jgi:hypothetical protein
MLTAEEVGVLFGELRPLFGEIVEGEDRGNGANRHAGAAIDALHGIDVEHLDVGESRVFLLGVDAVDGAGVDARCVFGANAGFRNYVCHMFWNFQKYHTASCEFGFAQAR